MKILAINCKPDLSYFTERGLKFDIEYKTINEIFPLQFLYNVQNQYGVSVPMYTPAVGNYLEANYKTFQYSFIMVGWKPSDYSDVLKNTGGYTSPFPLSCGTRWITVRQDPTPNNNYAIHELHHGLCAIINVDLANHVPIDYMDKTLVNGVWQPYYLNDFPNNPASNYAVTWNNIKPFLSQLLAIKYNTMPEAQLSRSFDWGNETVGLLSYKNYSWNTLELGWKNNKSNVSSIPSGRYLCKWTFSPKFLKYTYEITGVPNRSGIRIHSANLYSQLLGCVALGHGYDDINSDKLPDILNSKKAIEEFNSVMNKQSFYLTVK